MLERMSALASAKPYVSARLMIAERGGFTLTQLAGLDADCEHKLSAVLGPLPQTVGIAQHSGDHTILRIGPSQFWLVGPERDEAQSRLQGACAVTPLSSSRVRMSLQGAPAREVLAKLMPIDFHHAVFTVGRFALTGLHHTPVTVICTGDNSFDIYAMRTFALNVWEVVTDAALAFADSR
jgi:heterotetrameric sarcosine oxidase gamma subunit